MKKRQPDLARVAILLFGLFCVVLSFGIALYLAGWRRDVLHLTTISSVLGVLFIGVHGAGALGWRRFLAFALLAAFIGYWVEVFSLHHASLFGCAYRYHPDRWNDMVLGMPLTVALFWAVFIYGGYAITNAFLYYLGASKPRRRQPGAGVLLVLLPLVDATVVTSIDIFMDPLVTWRGSWIWEQEGPFYGVPIGNFVGWFLISWLASALFRSVEFFRPGKNECRHGPWSHLTMPLAYGLLTLMFTVFSLSIRRPEITLTGLFAMGPIGLLALLAFVAARRREAGMGPFV